MALPSPNRRLAAILHADVHGFSRLMGADELWTVRQIGALRSRVERTFGAHRGRLVDFTGDSLLAEFPSAVHAAEAALALQHELVESHRDSPPDRRMRLRIGINVGDVILEGGAIFGDGVNIAARLQALAEPDGICVSGNVHEAARSRVEAHFEYLGEPPLKNIEEKVPVYRLRARSQGRIEPAPTPPALSQALVVAVLPFENLSHDDALAPALEALLEDLVAAISRFRDVSVISADAAFHLRPDRSGRRRAAPELGIHYALDGSVVRGGDRVRYQVRLTDVRRGEIAWAGRFDAAFDAAALSNDPLVQSIVAMVVVQLEQSEQRSPTPPSDADLRAFRAFLAGQRRGRLFTREGNEQARRFYLEALRLKPDYTRALAALSRTHHFDWRYAWSDSPRLSLDRALDLARRSVSLDEVDARAHAELGFVYLFMREHDAAIGAYERAVRLNPNDTEIMADMADALGYAGRAEEAIGLLESSLRLNPFNPDWRLWSLGDAYYTLGRYERVVETLSGMRDPAEGHRLLAASFAQLGRRHEAARHAEEVRRRQPDFSAARWSEIQPDRDRAGAEHYLEGLRRAGL